MGAGRGSENGRSVVTKRAQVDRAVADALAQFGQIDILVNNAGWDRMEMFLDSEEETWDKIIAFSKTLAREMARHKITVNVVCPGLTETPLLQSIREQSPKTKKVIAAVTRAIPLGRVGQPEDIAGAVVYLASPAADFVTGQTLSVSGGLTMA